MAGSPSRMLQAPGKGRSKESPLPGSARDGLRQLDFNRTRSKHNQPIHQKPNQENPVFPKEHVDSEVVVNPRIPLFLWLRPSLRSPARFPPPPPPGALPQRRDLSAASSQPQKWQRNQRLEPGISLEERPEHPGGPGHSQTSRDRNTSGFFLVPQRTQGLSNGVSPFPQLLRDNRERLENPGMCFGMRFPGNRPRVFRGCSKQINLCS